MTVTAGLDVGVAPTEGGDAFQQVQETLGPGIHDARLKQHRQLLGRVRQGPPGALQRGANQACRSRTPERSSSASAKALITLSIVPSCGSATASRAERAPAAHRARQVGGRHRHAIADASGHAGQELRQDRAGIAAATIDGFLADPSHQLAHATCCGDSGRR